MRCRGLRPYAPNTAVFFLLLFCTGLVTGLIGAAFEVTILRRIYQAPELFQLLATFAFALIVQDAALSSGPEDLLRACARQV
jgi:branched-chain amino acid transport system permease protein